MNYWPLLLRHYARVFTLVLFGISSFWIAPLISSPAYAEMVESCAAEVMGGEEIHYCHCAGNKIVCPDEHRDWWPLPKIVCKPYITKQECKPTIEKCIDSGLPEEKSLRKDDATAKDAKCVPNETARVGCTCDNPVDAQVGKDSAGKNGKTCTLKDGSISKTFCDVHQYCQGAGECAPMDCTCDGDDKMNCSKSGAPGTGKTIQCGKDKACTGNPGKAKCVSEQKKELGNCRCAGKNKIECDNGDPADCADDAKCVNDPKAELGVRCEDKKPKPTLPPPPSPPCLQWTNDQCTQFGSAFGGISTDPAGFITKLFAVLLSLSGGIALLLIMRAGYQMMTSQGKPEQLNNGRDQLVAAIVGLVFLIFSFLILQIIGFDILRIPGFGGSAAQGATCDPNATNPCDAGLSCVYNGRSGTCQGDNGIPRNGTCNPSAATNPCAAGLSCRYNGSGGQCQ